MSNTALRWVAGTLSVLAVVVTVATILLLIGGVEPTSADIGTQVGDLLATCQTPVVAIVALIVILRLPRHPIQPTKLSLWLREPGARATAREA